MGHLFPVQTAPLCRRLPRRFEHLAVSPVKEAELPFVIVFPRFFFAAIMNKDGVFLDPRQIMFWVGQQLQKS